MCGSFRRTARALTQMYEESLRPLGLRATQFTILQGLARAGEVSQGQLGEMLAMDSTSLTRTLAIMRRAGWVCGTARGRPPRAADTVVRGGGIEAQASAAGLGEGAIAAPGEAREAGVGESFAAHASRNRNRQDTRRFAMTKYGKITAGLLAVWFVAVFYGVGRAFIRERIVAVRIQCRCSGFGAHDCVFVVACGVRGISKLCIVVEPENSDFGAGVADCGIHVPSAAGAKRVASDLCVAGGIWGHVHWSYGRVRGLETCGACASQQFYFLAGAGHFGPGYGGQPGHDGTFA